MFTLLCYIFSTGFFPTTLKIFVFIEYAFKNCHTLQFRIFIKYTHLIYYIFLLLKSFNSSINTSLKSKKFYSKLSSTTFYLPFFLGLSKLHRLHVFLWIFLQTPGSLFLSGWNSFISLFSDLSFYCKIPPWPLASNFSKGSSLI